MKSRQVTCQELELWKAWTQGLITLPRPGTAPALPPPKPPKPVPIENSHHLDLHGLTLHQAHAQTLDKIVKCRGTHKSLVFVTGKSGQIRQEFPHWLETHPMVRSVKEINGGGAFRVHYRKVSLNKR